jgi:hypothetical protein
VCEQLELQQDLLQHGIGVTTVSTFVAAQRHKPNSGWTLALGALGVVYGGLGTNPLFALRECFTGRHGLPLTRENILGCASLALWGLIIVITASLAGSGLVVAPFWFTLRK